VPNLNSGAAINPEERGAAGASFLLVAELRAHIDDFALPSS
jgi:hypothetical protein